MSTSVNPSAAPSEAPEPSTPQAVTPQRPGSRAIRYGVLLLLVAAAAAAYWFLRPRPQKAAAVTVTHTGRVVIGTIQRVLRLTGTTSAARYANIAAPLLRGPESGRALTLIYLAKSGTWAKKAEKVAEIDGQAAKDHIDDTDATVQTAEADIRKRKAEQAISSESLRQALTQAKSRLDKAKLEYGAAEIRTTIDQELLKLSVEQYEAEYKEQLADIKTSEIAQKSELRILELTRDRHIRHRDRHIVDLKRFTIITPMDGLVVMQSIYRSGDWGQIQVGDQVAPNQPFMKIVDPKSMQVDATINQVESELIRIGQPATVYFDAFPGLKLKGRVFSIGALAVGGWRQNYYIRAVPVKIELLEQEPRVIPDLSAGADVVVDQKENVLTAPLAAMFTERGKTLVFVKSGDAWVEREVKLGMASNTDVEILAGLKRGEELALQHPVMRKPGSTPGK